MVLPNGWPTKGVGFYFRLGPLHRSHNCRRRTCLEQDLNLRKAEPEFIPCWMKFYSSDNLYIMACVEIYCIKHLLMSSSLESTPVPLVWHTLINVFYLHFAISFIQIRKCLWEESMYALYVSYGIIHLVHAQIFPKSLHFLPPESFMCAY